jgi:hypothetical protein
MPVNKKEVRRNPTLQSLDVLSGQWSVELSEAAFLPDPSGKITMRVSFEWIENGAFLAMRLPMDPPDSVWIIGRDDSSENYTVLYFDSRGVSRVYTMSISENVWKIWRNSPNFSQRFEGKISEDGNSIRARWEKSVDSKTWEHDFSLTYKRV